MEELRRGLLRHAGVRAAAADADSEDVEQTLSVLHEPDYLEALAEVSDRAGGDPGADPARPAARHSGLRRPGRGRARGGAHGDDRGRAPGRRAPASPTRSAGRPGHHAGPAWFAGYCYLNTAAAAVQILRQAGVQPGRHPRHRPALPQRHRGDRGDDGGHQPALAARRAGDQRRRRHGRTDQRSRGGDRVPRQFPTPTTTSTPSPDRSIELVAGVSRPSSSRSATTSSPATRTAPGPSSPRSSPRSAVCSPPPARPSA